jgi:hypothetical protein
MHSKVAYFLPCSVCLTLVSNLPRTLSFIPCTTSEFHVLELVYTYYPLLMCFGPPLSCNIYTAEDYFTERAMGDVRALKENNPGSALVLDEFDTANPPHLSSLPYKQRPLAEVTVGSYVLVKAGEVVPVDGEVWKGKATVNVEHLTGEATPIEKQVGDSIPGGARNLDGLMIVKVMNNFPSHHFLTRSKTSYLPQLGFYNFVKYVIL